MSVLDLGDHALSVINLFNQLVLQVNDSPLQLLELKAIFALNLLLGYVKHLGKVTLKNFDILTLLADDSLQSIFTCAQPLLQLVDLVFEVISFLSNFIKVFRHFSADFRENSLHIFH